MTSPRIHTLKWLAALILTLVSFNLLAYSSGITGRSTAGCMASGCHGYTSHETTHITTPTPSYNYNSTLTVNNSSVLINDIVNVRFAMSRITGSTAARSGFNMSASGGTLAEFLSYMESTSGEITHNTNNPPSPFVWGSTSNSNLRWTAPGTPGNYTIYACGNVVSGTNGRLNDGSYNLCQSQAISVHTTPVIAQGTSVTVNMSEDSFPVAFSRTLSVLADSDSHTLTWSILSQATNGTATASGTGTSKAISYIPDANYNGSDSFVVSVIDNGFSDTITVNVNISAQADNPIIVQGTSVLVNMSEDSSPTPFSRLLSASDADSGDTLTWSISSAATNGSAAVSGTGTIKAISYTPNANYNGSDSFIVTVTDSTARTDSITVNVNISAQADNPVITQGNSILINMSEDSSPSPFSLQLNATDNDGGTLTWSISTPAGNGTAAASGSGASKTIMYSPGANYNGSDSFVVRVTDNTLRTDSILVNVNIAVINDAPLITSTAPASGIEDTLYTYTVLVNDPDDTNNGSNLTYLLSNAPTGMIISSLGVINWTPINGVLTSGAVTVSVSDGGENGAVANMQIFTVAVAASNDPPVITSTASTVATEDIQYTYNVNVTDPDDSNNGIDITYALSNAPPGMQVSATGLISWTPLEGVNTSGTVTVSVSDGGENGAAPAAEKFSIAVTPVNDSPVITSAASITATEDVLYTYSIAVNDPDDINNGTDLNYMLNNAPAGMSISSTGVISWTPLNGVTTSGSIMVSVVDGGEDGAVASNQNFTIAVIATNDAPQITSVAPTTASEGAQYIYNVSVSDPDDANNGTDLSYVLGNAPAGMQVSGTGQITWTPPEGNTTSGSVSITVSDGGENGAAPDTEIFSLSVTPVNDPPSITSSAVTSAIEGIIYSYQLTISDPDDINNGTDISFALSNTPVGMSVSTTGLITWTPPQTGLFNDATAAITISASDGLEDGASPATEVFSISINPPDGDGDLVADYNDNCPVDSNNDQLDTDTDGLGDVCDNDPTGSGLLQTFIVFSVDQSGKSGNVIFQDGGGVTVTADLDSNIADGVVSHDFLSLTQGELIAAPVASEDTLSNTFEFDPSALPIGTYMVDVTINNDGSTAHNTLLINVLASTAPLLNTIDTDGDGTNDDDPSEGFADDDTDGIPNYRDNLTEPLNKLSVNTASSFANLVQSPVGTRLSIGDISSASGLFAATITEDALTQFGNNGGPAQNASDDSYTGISEIFDFVISDIPQIGDSINIVFPLTSSIRANAIYRKYTAANGWQDFVVDGNNQIFSAKATAGICPIPGSNEYVTGLNAFDNCLQLYIQDGGPNDSDGEINGIIRDPGTIVIDANAVSAEDGPCASNNENDFNNCASNSGSVGTLHPLWILFIALPVLYRKRIRVIH
jgi:Big-like domain-containing protein/putative Ig domain-containing protein